jgi:hypothetical protein
MKRLRAAAAYEILAGLLAVAFTVRPRAIPGGSAIGFNIYALALAFISILAGVYTWAGHQRARKASLTLQLCQIVQVSSSAFVFGTLVGIEGSLRFQGWLVSLYTTYGVRLLALRPSETVPTVVSINLVAATVAAFLWFGRPRPAVTVASGPDPRTSEQRRDAVEERAG